jgi:hypothetical protein
MQAGQSWLVKARFCTNIGLLYVFTAAFAWYVVHNLPMFNPGRYVSITRTAQKPLAPLVPNFNVISGVPVRIVIPDSSYHGVVVDLPIDEGYYDQSTETWTLSGYRAQFMMISSLANNYEGDTYIYGHNNDYVFGALRHVTPAIGSTALLYTSNGHIFSYSFVSVSNVGPNTTTVLNYQGPPVMTIQTCTGSFNAIRTLYKYNFVKVIQ